MNKPNPLDNPRIRDWSENLDEIIEQGLDEIVGQEIKPGSASSRKPRLKFVPGTVQSIFLVMVGEYISEKIAS